MKRFTALLIAGAMLLLAGCEGNTAVTVAETSPTAAETTTAETSASTTTTTLQTTTAPVTTEPLIHKDLASLTSYEFEQLNFNAYDSGKEMLSKQFNWDKYNLNGNTITYDGDGNYRSSSLALFVGDDTSLMSKLLATRTFIPFSNFATNHKLWESDSQLIAENADCTDDCDYVYGYLIDDAITTKAFIKRDITDKSKYTFIIDPAYMHGIPVSSSNMDYLHFDINGTKIVADTLSFNATGNEELYDFGDSDAYIYARITFMSAECSFSTKNGYSNNAYVSAIELISTDTDKVLTEPYLFTDDKDPEMSKTYNTLLANYKSILTDNTVGITLLDLDFDGTPELLVSNRANQTDENGEPNRLWQQAVDVDVYRLSSGKLKYIDSLYHNLTNVYSNGNVLGLKTLPDGSKSWFSMSRIDRSDKSEANACYAVTLEGDKLKFDELFKYKGGEENDGQGTIWVDGKDISSEIVKTYVDEDGPAGGDYYEWGGNSWWSYYLLFTMIESDYCEDMKDSTFTLLSDWLVSYNAVEYIFSESEFERFPLTDRDFSYHLAYLTDSAYLGEYDSAKQRYEYRFVGDMAKPVIYLYPEEEIDVSVKVDLGDNAEFSCTYPDYGEGWSVTAQPDGTLFDKDGNEYYCLYWEAKGSIALEDCGGFCVRGSDTAAFLREKLSYIGLTAREINEFIIYWLPLMEDNAYNVITLHTKDYASAVPMEISPAPQSVIRVFMTFAPSEEFVSIPAQELPHYERSGFTVVEWGGGKAE